jgi:hypothetical protein
LMFFLNMFSSLAGATIILRNPPTEEGTIWTSFIQSFLQ